MSRRRVQTFIFVGSIVLAFLLQLTSPQAFLPLKPYWIALVLIYWSIEAPERMGLGFAFLIGLAGDLLTGQLLGEQALRLIVLVFIVLRFRSRLRFFPLSQQALAVLALLLNDRIVVIMVRGFPGIRFPRWVSGFRPSSACSPGRSCSCCWMTCAHVCAHTRHEVPADQGWSPGSGLVRASGGRRFSCHPDPARRARRALLVPAGVPARRIQARSDANRILTRPLAPARGLIYDRNGVLLAENVAAFRLEVIPEQVADMDALLHDLQDTIGVSDDDIARFKALVKSSVRTRASRCG